MQTSPAPPDRRVQRVDGPQSEATELVAAAAASGLLRLTRQQGAERGEGSPVPRAIRRLLRANDIRERGDGDHQTAEIVLDDVGLQVVIAGGPGWHERNVEIAELRRQIDELHVVKEGCVTGERQPRGRVGTADPCIHRPQGGGERVRFSERRDGQMSASPVRSGEPCSVAASPPISTYCTP